VVSGSQVARIDCPSCNEGLGFVPDTTGSFEVPHSHIAVYVGYLGSPAICPAGNPNNACAYVTLTAFDSGGKPVGTPAIARVVQGQAMQLISVSTPSAQIVGFEIKARDVDTNKEIAIDDLSFAVPSSGPSCQDVSASTGYGHALAVQLTCTDSGGAPLTYAIDTSPAHGALGAVNQTTGQLTYTPNAGYAGADSFTYHATSTTGTAPAKTVTITVNPPQPPTAAIASPADGSVVKLRSSVATKFSCVDSGGADGSSGRLDTARLGVHSYSVTATSSGGQTGTAMIQYTVTRSGRGVRPVINVPGPLLNAAVQPCALIVCAGNLGPHTNLMNAVGGNNRGDYCKMYQCSPMDLIPTSGFDYNLFPYNPDWAWFDNTGTLPDAISLCNEFKGHPFTPGSPPCTGQNTTVDSPDFGSFTSVICNQGRSPYGAFHGHVNYEPATYEGTLTWFEKSSVGADDEYSLDLTTPNLAGVTSGNNYQKTIHIEFDSDETVDHFDDNAWWKWFHDSVDNGQGYFVTGALAEVTGLVGLDTVHGASAELHPVYAIAIETNPYTTNVEPKDPRAPNFVDRWAVFARNWGNEGYCSTDDHSLPNRSMWVRIPWHPGATGVRVLNNSTDLWANFDNPAVSGRVIPNYGLLLKFDLNADQPLWWGTIDVQWTYPPNQGGPPRLRIGSVSSAAPGQRSASRRREGGVSADVERFIKILWDRLPARTRKQALTRLPHPTARLPDTTRAGIVMAPPPSGLLPPPGPFVFPRLAPAVMKRDKAEAHALCWAYRNHIPGLAKACPRRVR
jgi:hypothetical protein